MNAVLALRIAKEIRMQRLLTFLVEIATAVVHAVDVAIFENRMIRRGAALPWRVMDENDLALARLLQLKGCAGERVDEIVVNKQLAAGIDSYGVGPTSGRIAEKSDRGCNGC